MSPENTHHRPSIRQPRPQQLKVSVGLSEHTPRVGVYCKRAVLAHEKQSPV
jgi:hypothetical protein